MNDFERAERRFRELQAQRDKGRLDDEMFRVEVAKLLLRDDQGIFWMLDADGGTWFCNRGEGWAPCDPRTARPMGAALPARRERKTRRLGQVLILGTVLLVLLGAVGTSALFHWPPVLWSAPQPTPEQSNQITVTIASPADGSEVFLGQEVAIESTVDAMPDLQAVDRVVLLVNGQLADRQAVQSRVGPDQTSLPLSQLWRPPEIGEYELAVTAVSAEDLLLGTAAVTLHVIEASEEALPEPACVPDAAFIADVTIPAGTAFPPRARMEKVWQVRNSGTCAWGMSYELVLVEGDVLGAQSTAPVPPTVAGETADLAVTFQAPGAAGAYANTWQLRAPDGSFFGPTLILSVEVEVQAQESQAPTPPANLQATVTEGGDMVRLTWEDRSDNEDAFRVYREDVEANIGLAPANAELFVDEEVACGGTYRYTVVAFNASGASPVGEAAEVSMPPCAPPDVAPTLALTVVPTQVTASEVFTIAFEANDDHSVEMVIVWGVETGNDELDTGRLFTCTEVVCTANWSITWTEEISTTLRIVAVARDSAGHESEPVSVPMIILPPE